MAKRKTKEILRKFILDVDPCKTKEIVREMHDFIMLTDEDISTEQRRDFTLTCQSVERLMNDISAISKKLLRKKKSSYGLSS